MIPVIGLAAIIWAISLTRSDKSGEFLRFFDLLILGGGLVIAIVWILVTSVIAFMRSK